MVVAKIVRIQFVEGTELKKYNKAQQKKIVQPKRGDIFSIDGKVLACSVPEYIVSFDYRIQAFQKSDTLFKNYVDELAEGLARIFVNEGKSKKYYYNLLQKAAKKNIMVRLHNKPIDYATLQKVKQLPILKEGSFKGGLNIVTSNNRVYPYGDIAKRTIGLLRKGSFHGQTGIELFYDNFLYGVESTKNTDQEPGAKNENNGTVDGYDIVTTISTEIQSITDEELLKGLIDHKASWGCAIVMDVKTGEILSIVNLSHNSNPEDSAYYEIQNFAVDYRCDPGSTIKLASLMIGLEDGAFGLDDTIDIGNGRTTYSGKDVVDHEGGPRGRISVKQAFAHSSNVGVSKLIYNNYVATKKSWDFVERLQSMGLDKISGIDLQNERKPLVKDPSMITPGEKNPWSKLSLVQMSYGYEIELTPLQILYFYNAVANNGKMVQPHLVKEIKSDSKKILEVETKVTNTGICSQATIDKAKILLESVVQEGTASALKSPYYKIAGKTGTAVTIINGAYSDIQRGSFCGYFPAENPKYSCIIVMQGTITYEPYKIWGATAAEVFKKISDRIYFSDVELRNQLSTDNGAIETLPAISNGYSEDFENAFTLLKIPHISSPKSNWTNTSVNQTKVEFSPIMIEKNKTPNFVGMGMRDALFLAENSGLRVQCKGYGKIVRQSLIAGTTIKKDQTIVLEFN
jgi:cell division protein FtsI (penicillin-binding protein 3)